MILQHNQRKVASIADDEDLQVSSYKEFTSSWQRQRDETGFHSDLTDVFKSEIIVKADFVHQSSILLVIHLFNSSHL